MANPNQNESLLDDYDAPLASPHTLLGSSHTSKTPSTAHTRVGYSQVSKQSSAHPSPTRLSPAWPSPGVKDGFDDLRIHDLQNMREKDTAMKRKIRRVKFFLRIFTLALAIHSLVTMVYTLKHFFETRGHQVVVRNISAGGEPVERGPWSKESKTWPTVLLMATSAITLLLNAIVMVAYFKSVETANTTATYFTYISYIIAATHVGMWIPTAAAYRAGKNGEDLWGWSCSIKAEQIQVAFLGVVDFKHACNVQTAAWASSVAEALLMILTFFLWWWEYRRLKHKRDLQTHHSIGLKETRWSKMVPTGHKL